MLRDPALIPHLEELEPRLLYAADFSPGVLAGLAGQQALLETPAPGSLAAAGLEIAFIDLALPQAQTLVQDLNHQAAAGRPIEVVTVAPGQDGIALIGQVLAERQGVSAVHLLGHGAQASMQLGSTTLDEHSLLERAGEVAQWRAALSDAADLLLYGCGTGAQEAGQRFIMALGQLTGADMAASADATGAAVLGGNWQLENATGPVEAQVAPSAPAQQAWLGLMAPLGRDSFLDAGELVGARSGSGWAGAWTSVYGGGDLEVVPAGLNDPTGLLPTSGGAVQFQSTTAFDGAAARRALDSTVGAVNTTTWFSFLVRPDDVTTGAYIGLVFGNAGSTIAYAGYNGNDFVLQIAGGGSSASVSGVSAQSGVAAFLVVSVEHKAGLDVLTMYVNPTPGLTGPGGAPSVVRNFDLGSFSSVDIRAGRLLSANNAQLDELRIGQSYAEVAPSITSNAAEVLVNTTTAGTQATTAFYRGSPQAVDAAPNGQHVVVWTDGTGTGAGVRGQRFDGAGNRLGGEIQINQTTNGEQARASVAVADNGQFVVVWDGNGPSDSAGVFARIFNADGTPLTNEFKVNTTTGGTQFNAAVDADAAGNFVVAWLGIGGGGWDDVFAKRFNAAGQAQGSEFLVSAGTSDPDEDPAVSMADDGKFAVAWDSGNGTWVRRYSAAGNPVTGSAILVDGSATSGNADVQLRADGSVVVAYRDYGGTDTVYLALYDTTGTQVFTRQKVNTTVANNTHPSLGMDSTGAFYVMWEGSGPGDSDGVFMRRYAANGTALSGEILVNKDTAGLQSMGSLVVMDNGAIHVVWSGSGAGDDAGVFARTFNAPTEAVNDSASTPHSVPVTLNPLANDTGNQGLPVTLLDATNPSHGSALIAGDNLVYTPTANYVDADALNYRVDDGTQGLTHYWRLDGNGTDLIGGSDATLFGTPGTTVGALGQALNFDKVDDYATVPDITYGNEFTVSLWFRLADNDGTGFRYLFNHGDNTAVNSLSIYVVEAQTIPPGSQNKLRTGLFDSNDALGNANLISLDVDVVTHNLADNQWHQYTLTVAGSASTVYIDGVQRATSAQGGDAFNPAGTVSIGARTDNTDTTRLMKGGLDGLATYNRALSAIEVADLYGGGLNQATVSLTVSPGTAPVINTNGGGNTGAISVPETTTAVTTVTATDDQSPHQTVEYSIVGGADAGRFTIAPSTGELSFNVAPDYENPDDANGDRVYVVQVQASDGVLTDTQTLNIAVQDVSSQLVITTTAYTDDSGLPPGYTIEQLNAVSGGGDGKVSLREALTAANNTAGTDRITFNIASAPGPNGWEISPAGTLAITTPVLLDASTQPGYSMGAGPQVTLRGTGVTGSLQLLANDSTINALRFADFNGDVITVAGTGNTVTNNLIQGNAGDGIVVTGAQNIIGEYLGDGGNTIVGSGGGGIRLSGPGATNNSVSGNRIGFNTLRQTGEGNGGNGITLEAGASHNTVGGVFLRQGNQIAYQGGVGIRVVGNATTANALIANETWANNGLGIDLGVAGVNANDAGDADSGPNDLQNAPVLSNAVFDGARLTLDVALSSTASSDYRIDFYRVTETNGLGAGDASTYLGYVEDSTGVSGTVSFGVSFPKVAFNPGDKVTAVATLKNGGGGLSSSSEYALNAAVTFVPLAGVTIGGTTPVAQTAEFRVNTATPGVQTGVEGSVRTVAVAPDGSSVHVWVDKSGLDGDSGGIYAQRFNASGTSLGAGAFRVNTTTSGNQSQPSLGMDASGNFVVVWTSSVGTDGDGSGVYGQRFLANGTMTGGEFKVNVIDAGAQQRPEVAMFADGSFVVGWSTDESSSETQLAFRHFAADGTGDVGQFTYSPLGVVDVTMESMAALPSGGIVVTMARAGDVYVMTLNSSFADVVAARVVNTGALGMQNHSVVRADAAGNFTVVWESSREQDGSAGSVMMRRFSSAGVALDVADVAITSRTVGYQYAPSLAMDSAGNAVVVWQDGESRDGSGDGVYLRRFDSVGRAVGDEVLVNTTTTGNQYAPAVALGSADELLVGWSGKGLVTGSIDDSGVFARRFSFGAKVTEGATLTIPVVLDKAPTAPVSLSFSVSDATEASLSTTTLTFTPLNWNTAQNLVLTGSQDLIADGAQRSRLITGAAASADAAYSGLVVDDLPVLTQDNGALNVAPVITSNGGQATANVNVNEGLVTVTTVQASDSDGLPQPLVYAISGPDAAAFQINPSTGVLTLRNEPDYEAPADLDQNNVYELVVSASDGMAADTQALTVTILDVSSVLRVTTVQDVVSTDLPSNFTAEQLNALSGGDDQLVSLREAMLAANQTAGSDFIGFNLVVGGTNGVYTFTPSSALPALNDSVTLDGWSQPSWMGGAPVVVINGSAAGSSAHGLQLNGDNSLVRGLVIQNFGGDGVQINGAFNTLQGSFIGTSATGNTVAGNGGSGVLVTGGNVLIGGGLPGQGNVIAGNSLDGVRLSGASGSSGRVQGNAIGLSADGATALGNAAAGVRIAGGAGSNMVGGLGAGEANRIAGSGVGGVAGSRDGIVVTGTGLDNSFLANLIFLSDERGIDLNNDGYDTNDNGDADGLANGTQNFPVLTLAESRGTNLRITGSLNTNASLSYRIDFYRVTTADIDNMATPQGEATAYLGFTTVATNSSGNATFDITLNGVAVPTGDRVTAVATRILSPGVYGSSSEFAVNRAVTASVQAGVSVSAAAPQAVGTAVAVNAGLTTGEQWSREGSSRTLAVGSDGGWVQVWVDAAGNDGTLKGVYFQRFEANGSALPGGPVLVAPAATNAGQATVAMASDGRFTIAWAAVNGPSTDVYLQRYTAAGAADGGVVTVNTTTVGHQTRPEVGYANNGSSVVAWTSESGSVLRTYFQRFDSTGAKTGGEVLMNTVSSASQTLQGLAVRGNGSFALVWSESTDVYLRNYSAGGSPLTAGQRVNTITDDDQQNAVIGADALGNLVIAWESELADGSGNAVVARRFDANATALGSEFVVTTNRAGDQSQPALAVDGQGQFVIAWTDASGQDASGKGVFLQRFNAGGNAVGPVVSGASVTLGDQSAPVVALNATGRLVLGWQGSGAGDNQGVFAQPFDVAPKVLELGTSSYTLVLQSAPTADVTITLASSNLGAFTLSASAFTFTPGNWNQPQTVQVLGTEDGVVDGTQGATVTAQVASADAAYNNLPLAPMPVLVLDSGLVAAPPVINSDGGGDTAALSVLENATAVTTVVATDADTGSTLTYSLAGGADEGLFEINAATGVLRFKATPNFENPLDAGSNNVYNVIVRVGDGLFFDTQALSVTVANVNEAPSAANARLAVDEDTARVITATDLGFTDADLPANLLATMRITTLPALGSLTLAGAPVVVNQEVSAADLAAGRLVWTPPANQAGNGLASFNFRVRDDGGTANGGVNLSTMARTLTFDVSATNDAPTLTAPGAQQLSKGGHLVFSNANGNALGVADVDAGGAVIQLQLAVTSGSLTLAQRTGLLFSTGDGIADGEMQFTGTLANVNAALQGLRFDPAMAATGAVTLAMTANDLGNTGSGGDGVQAQLVTLNVVDTELWWSTENNASVPTSTGPLSWTDTDVLRLADPFLQLGAGANAGTISLLFNLDDFASDARADLRGLHYVAHDTTVGTVDAVSLLAGDVLFSVKSGKDLTGSNGVLAVTDKDIIAFRPVAPGNYSTGAFYLVLRQPSGGNAQVADFALVESAVTVGGTALAPGEFLLLRSGDGSQHNTVYRFQPGDLSGAFSDGVMSTLLDGDSPGMGIADKLTGLALVEANITMGGVTLAPGQLLLGLSKDDGSIGTNGMAASDGDVIVFTATATGVNTSAGSASAFMQAAAMGLDNLPAERPDALALVQKVSRPPVLDLASPAPVYVENGLPVALAPAATLTDPDTAFMGGGSVTVALPNGTVSDRLAVQHTGLGAGEIGVAGADVLFGGAVIGQWQGGTQGQIPLRIDLNAAATAGAVQALLRALVFSNDSENPSTVNLLVWIQVNDGAGGSSDVGVANVQVQAVNDAPTATGFVGTLSYAENAPATLVAPALSLADVDSPTLAWAQIAITGNHAAAEDVLGFTALSGITANWDSAAGILRFNGVASLADYQTVLRSVTYFNSSNAPSELTRTLTLSANDGGASNANLAHLQMNVDVVPQNDAPVITTNQLVISEGGNAKPTLTSNDPDNTEVQRTYTVVSATNGWFALAATPAVAISTFTQSQMTQSLVRFYSDGGEVAPTYSLRLSDGAATSAVSSGVVSFTNVNDAPVWVTNSLTVSEGGTAVPVVVINDPDSLPNTITLGVQSVVGGRMVFNSAPLVSITSFTLKQLQDGLVSFITTGNEAAPSYRLVLSDGVANALAANPALVFFTNVNDAPVISNNQLVISEGGNAKPTLTSTDPDHTAAQLTYNVDSADHGWFAFTTAPSTPISAFTQADMNANLVRFYSDGGELAPSYSLRLSDGTANSAVNAGVVNFTRVNDAPQWVDNGLAVDEGGSARPALEINDPDNVATQIRFTVSGVTGGRMALTTAPGTAITTFTLAQWQAGVVRFYTDGLENAPSYRLALSDGVAPTLPANSAVIVFTNVNDAPVITANTLVLTEGSFAVPGLIATDPDNTAAALTYSTVGAVTGGRFEWVAAPGVEINRFTQAQVNNGEVRFYSDGGEAKPTYTLSLSDGALDSAASAALVSYTPINDAPVVPGVDLGSLLEDGTRLITQTELLGAATDADGDALTAINLRVVAGGGTVVAHGDGTFTYRAALDITGPVSLAFEVLDAAMQVSGVATLALTPVNDAPVAGLLNLGSMPEDTLFTLTTQDWLVGVTDVDSTAFQVINPTLRVGQGTLQAVSGGTWQFRPAADWNGTVRFGFTVSDGALTVEREAVLTVEPVADAPRIRTLGGNPEVSVNANENQTATVAAVAFDPDAAAVLTWRIAGGADQNAFALNANSGDLRLLAAPNFEQPADANGDGRYELVLEVSDGALTASQRLTVVITNVDEAPVIVRHSLVVGGGFGTITLVSADVDTSAAGRVYEVSKVTGGYFENMRTGQSVTQFTQADADGNLVRLVRFSQDVVPSYELQLRDDRSQVTVPAPDVKVLVSQVEPAPAPVAPPVVVSAPAPAPGGSAVTPSAVQPKAGDGDKATAGDAQVVDDSEASLAGVPRSKSGNSASNGDTAAAQRTVLVAAVTLEAPPANRPPAMSVPTSEVVQLLNTTLQSELRTANQTVTLGQLDVGSALRERNISQAMDRVRDEVVNQVGVERQVLASGAVVSAGLSVGYVLWLARGGVLVAGLLSALPAWAGMDPLPVLSQMKRDDDEDDGDDGTNPEGDDALENLFSKARKWVGKGEGGNPPEDDAEATARPTAHRTKEPIA